VGRSEEADATQGATHAEAGVTDDTRNIHQRMHDARQEVSYVQKGEKQVNGQYKFVGHDAVTALVRAAMLKHRILSVVDVVSHTQDGNRTEVDVRVTYINIDSPTDRFAVNSLGYGIDPQDKGPGKAMSYAVKYAYLKSFALETGEDIELSNIDHKPNSARQVAVDAFEAMPEDEQKFLQSKATELIALCESDQGDVVGYLDGLHLQTEEKLALWALLPSKIRTQIKKAQEADRASLPKRQPTQAEYASQA